MSPNTLLHSESTVVSELCLKAERAPNVSVSIDFGTIDSCGPVNSIIKEVEF